MFQLFINAVDLVCQRLQQLLPLIMALMASQQDQFGAGVGHQEADHMAIAQVCDERSAVAVGSVAAGVATSSDASALQALGESLQAHHQVLDYRPVVLCEAGKHALSPE